MPNIKYELKHRQSQRLTLAPSLQRSLKLLELPLLELKMVIEEALTDNVMLEENTDGAAEDQQEDKKLLDSLETGPDEYFSPGEYEKEKGLQQKRKDYLESLITEPITLEEHLLHQLRLYTDSQEEIKAGWKIISCIDKNGYLALSEDDLGKETGLDKKVLRRFIRLINTFDPPGIGSKDLRESLLVQLKLLNKEKGLSAKIVVAHLDDLSKKRFSKIARRLGATIEEVETAYREISSLEPRPARLFKTYAPTQALLPEVILKKDYTSFRTIANDDFLPRLRISSTYKRLLHAKGVSQQVKGFLKDKLFDAVNLIQAIQKRKETLHQVVECIVKLQKKFLNKGIGYLRPMSLKDVASRIERSKSTVSRVISGKYIQTPYGVFALKFFFLRGIKSKNDKVISNKSIEVEIGKIIRKESDKAPLSDREIAGQIQKRGINISRRTVSKYRKTLNILPSYLRGVTR